MAEITRIFMFNKNEDILLEKRNRIFWLAMLGHVQADRAISNGGTILDVGCHQGGLLSLAGEKFRALNLLGIEPMKVARDIAQKRLRSEGKISTILKESEWGKIQSQSIDLILSHEVLPFIPDLEEWIFNIRRVLKPQAFAYIVSGCHSENPLWPSWKQELQNQGHIVYNYSPLELMKNAGCHGLSPSVRTLRDQGWAYYNPAKENEFSYPSVGALLDHQFRHKLLFRFQRID